jgi:putative PIN family toxin of toxin-antitoxin system
MPRAVLDTTALVSAFLSARPGGAAFELLQFAYAGRFELVLSEPILTEVADVVLTRPHLRTRYRYTDNAVAAYVNGLRRAATIVTDLPQLSVVRDKTDDIILATAVAAAADYLCTRDRDLLDLQRYHETVIVPPEELLALIRAT